MLSLLAMHRSRRNDTNTRALPAQGKGHMQQPLRKGVSQRVPARFQPAMTPILNHKQWLTEEQLLGLRLADPVLICALASVSGVPIETSDTIPIDHLYIIMIYKTPSTVEDEFRAQATSVHPEFFGKRILP